MPLLAICFAVRGEPPPMSPLSFGRMNSGLFATSSQNIPAIYIRRVIAYDLPLRKAMGIGMATSISKSRVRRTAATGSAVFIVTAALLGFSGPASAGGGDWGHTPGTDLYSCTNPAVCGQGARTVGEGWVQVWCWTDSWFQRWFKVRAWTGKAWEEGWVPTARVDRQPSVPHC